MENKKFHSGTPNLEEAIPILEKWFDDVVSGKRKRKEVQAQSIATEQTSIQSDNSNQIENIQATNQSTTTTETKNDTTNLNQVDDEGTENKKSKFAFLDNLKILNLKMILLKIVQYQKALCLPENFLKR